MRYYYILFELLILKRLVMPNIYDDMDEMALSYATDGNVHCYNHLEKFDFLF